MLIILTICFIIYYNGNLFVYISGYTLFLLPLAECRACYILTIYVHS